MGCGCILALDSDEGLGKTGNGKTSPWSFCGVGEGGSGPIVVMRCSSSESSKISTGCCNEALARCKGVILAMALSSSKSMTISWFCIVCFLRGVDCF